MKRHRADRHPEQAVSRKAESNTNRVGAAVIWMTIVIATISIPLYYSPGGKDPFRLPKEILLRAEAMSIAALALAWPWRLPISISRRERQVILAAVAVVAWTVIITSTSTHRALSLGSLVRVFALAIIFVSTYLLAREKSLLALLAVIVPACINAADYIALSANQHTLFRIATDVADRPAAFLGNADDIGAFFVSPALACLAWMTLKGVRRMWIALAASLIVLGLIATQTLTSLLAFAAGAGTLILLRWRRRGLVLCIAFAVLAAVVVWVYPPLHTRVRVAIPALRSGNIDAILSGRSLPFYAAWQMFKDHPVFGVGPGCYGWQYFPYKLSAARIHPALLKSPSYALNFGEAHNDHLQMLAIGGLPAYLLFLGSLGWISSASWQRERMTAATGADADVRLEFASTFALPFTVALAVLAFAGFPLEIAATTSSNLFLAALLVRWRE